MSKDFANEEVLNAYEQPDPKKEAAIRKRVDRIKEAQRQRLGLSDDSHQKKVSCEECIFMVRENGSGRMIGCQAERKFSFDDQDSAWRPKTPYNCSFHCNTDRIEVNGSIIPTKNASPSHIEKHYRTLQANIEPEAHRKWKESRQELNSDIVRMDWSKAVDTHFSEEDRDSGPERATCQQLEEFMAAIAPSGSDELEDGWDERVSLLYENAADMPRDLREILQARLVKDAQPELEELTPQAPPSPVSPAHLNQAGPTIETGIGAPPSDPVDDMDIEILNSGKTAQELLEESKATPKSIDDEKPADEAPSVPEGMTEKEIRDLAAEDLQSIGYHPPWIKKRGRKKKVTPEVEAEAQQIIAEMDKMIASIPTKVVQLDKVPDNNIVKMAIMGGDCQNDTNGDGKGNGKCHNDEALINLSVSKKQSETGSKGVSDNNGSEARDTRNDPNTETGVPYGGEKGKKGASAEFMASISKKGNEAKRAKAEERKKQMEEMKAALSKSPAFIKLRLLFQDPDSWTQNTVIKAQSLVGEIMLDWVHHPDMAKNLETLLKAMHASVGKRDESQLINWDELDNTAIIDAVLFLKKHPVFGRVMNVPPIIRRRAWGFDFEEMAGAEDIPTPENVEEAAEWA